MPYENQPNCAFVCKFAKDPATPRTMYFNDVEAHEIATLYARKFNDASPEQFPRIGYVPAFIVEFVDRPGRPVCGCELLLEGKFRKYNNNVGAVCALSAEDQLELSRNAKLANWDPTGTAQAFSHFSWEHSHSAVLICDIQGVENRFTDPQIHTMSGKGFGLGNLGQTGIRAFLLRHTCTDMCRAVGLQPIKAKDLNEKQVAANFSGQSATHGLGISAVGANAAAASAIPGSQSVNKRANVPSNYNNSNNGGSNNNANSDVLVINDDSPTSSSSSSSSSMQQSRGMHSSASTAYISHQASQAVLQSRSNQQLQNPHSRQTSGNAPSAASSSLNAPATQGSAVSSSASTPQQSPSASPRMAAPQVQAKPTIPAPTKHLDDSDEALMASIMGE